MPSRFLSWLRQKLGCTDEAATFDALPAQVETSTAPISQPAQAETSKTPISPPARSGTLLSQIDGADISGRAVSARFHGEQSADVRFQNTNLEAREGDLNMFVRGGKSKWIVGQTTDSIMAMNHADLLKLWEAYRTDGRNPSIKGIDADALKEDYEDTPEGLAELREFITGYLAVSNGEEAG